MLSGTISKLGDRLNMSHFKLIIRRELKLIDYINSSFFQ